MKKTDKLLNIPPYISTTWKDISSLHTKLDSQGRQILVVTLQNSTQVEVPGLDEATLKEVFDGFAASKEEEKPLIKTPFNGPIHFSVPMNKGMPADSLGASMTHDPAQANLPNLPAEMLAKVTMIAKAFGLEDTSLLPKAEPHCNCVHCQIVRSLHGEAPVEEELAAVEETISEEDLKFRNWDILQTADKLYKVTNPLDLNEQYNVFLGDPLGCTCGLKNCEHIRAVLNS